MLKIAGAQFVGHTDKKVNMRRPSARAAGRPPGRADHLSARALQHDVLLRGDAPGVFRLGGADPGPDHRPHGRGGPRDGIVLIGRSSSGRPTGCSTTRRRVGPDGRVIGKYRKSSIPFMDVARSTEPRGNEKFYFEPGDLGFPTFPTPFGPGSASSSATTGISPRPPAILGSAGRRSCSCPPPPPG